MPDCRSGREAHALRNDKIVIFWYPQLTPGQPKNFQHQVKKTQHTFLKDFHNTTYTDTHREVSQATLDPYMTLCRTTQGLKTALAPQHQPNIALTTHHWPDTTSRCPVSHSGKHGRNARLIRQVMTLINTQPFRSAVLTLQVHDSSMRHTTPDLALITLNIRD